MCPKKGGNENSTRIAREVNDGSWKKWPRSL